MSSSPSIAARPAGRPAPARDGRARRWLSRPFAALAAAAPVAFLVVATALPPSAPAFAADPGADARRLATVRLDADSLRKVETATEKMLAAIKASPALARELKAAEEAEDQRGSRDGGHLSIAQMTRFYQSKPALRQAIESSGLTAESYSTTLIALMQASIAWGMSQAVPAERRAKALADTGVPAAHLDFVRQNQSRLEQMGQKLEAMNPDD